MTDAPRKAALQDLLAKVEAGEEYIERDIQGAFGGYRNSPTARDANKAYTGSLDAAMALHDAVLPNFNFMLTSSGVAISNGKPGNAADHVSCFATADSPARAWLIAILRALIAQEGET